MTPEGWVTNLGAILAALVAAYQSFGAKAEARKAKDFSAPTGNGFAQEVLSELSQIKDDVCDVKEQIQRVDLKVDTHIHDHVAESMRKKR